MELYKEVKQLTLEEVKKHDGVMEKTVWVVIRDIVYDVTEYMEDHPGGSDLILEHAGKDGTKDFENTGHSNDAKKELKKYKIGEIIELGYN
ncbi:unnamed protein product [Brassicogethes aeneus]|uniref:Cytochrome b5 heme-binding domain-containing protein n=1 Tax=Brassicogethes aeneus TaxID=1431903 RepID=A0A9P0BA58_BRAAE|nr:unnamed protein product [Brassicogethes aeneus]